MKTTSCVWCWKVVKVADDYDDLQNKAVCSRGCKDAETIFNLWMSDERLTEIAERARDGQSEDK